jgi:hypothetical protein
MNASTRMERNALVLNDTAREIGEREVCQDLGLFSAWLDQQAGGEREPSFMGPISTQDLVGLVLLNPNATDWQLAGAAKEIRKRYLADNAPEVERIALEALHA